jgi:hypothetical protein
LPLLFREVLKACDAWSKQLGCNPYQPSRFVAK